MTKDEELDLGELDSEEPFTFPPSERKVITQGYDLSVDTLVEQWRSEMLLLPELQREYVWDNVRASRLIESLLLNIPIPILYFVERPDAKYEVIDGHQRVKSVVRYINNEFRLASLRVLNELKGLRFHQLPEREQRFLRTRVMRAIVVTVDSHPLMKFEIFERLNTGSIALNAQEIRNALNQGLFNSLLKELEVYPAFRECLGTPKPRKRMVDRELIVRFFAMAANLNEYRPPLVRFLNNYMNGAKSAPEEVVEESRQLFHTTISKVAKTLGGTAFRATDPNGDVIDGQLNRALFDAQMMAFSYTSDEGPRITAKVKKTVATVYEDPLFLDAIRRATGDRSRTFRRIRKYGLKLQEAGFNIDIPQLLEEQANAVPGAN